MSSIVICPKCVKVVRDDCRAIECDLCNNWYHLRCSLLTSKIYKYYCETNDLWLCSQCRLDTFPFSNINNTELIELSFNSNTACLCSKQLSNLKLNSLPRLDILSSINSIPHLFDLDADVQLPTQTNFKYYTTHDFHNSYEVQSSFSKNSFSSIHCNIRSLAANFDHS